MAVAVAVAAVGDKRAVSQRQLEHAGATPTLRIYVYPRVVYCVLSKYGVLWDPDVHPVLPQTRTRGLAFPLSFLLLAHSVISTM